jgi:hypothetical protein
LHFYALRKGIRLIPLVDFNRFLRYLESMIQLYFLSILCNGLSGYILFAGSEGGTSENSRFSLNGPTFHLVLGIMSAATGILKLLSPSPLTDGKVILLFGDLVPAAAGVIAGLLLIFGIYRQDKSTVSETTKTLDAAAASLLHFRKSIGIGLLAVSLVHFLFPQALFL